MGHGSDLLAPPTGCAQVGFLLSDELADAVSPGAALYRVLSARTSFHEVKRPVHLLILNQPRLGLHRSEVERTWVLSLNPNSCMLEQCDLKQVI